MDTVGTILFLFMIGWSLISGITYFSRRSDARSAYDDILARSQPVRTLEESERTAIQQAFSTTPKNDSVYLVQGEATRHGLSSHGSTEWHLLIGGVEVRPFPQWALLTTGTNQVEVVLPNRGKVAIPVVFNGVTLADTLQSKAANTQIEARLVNGEQGSIDATMAEGREPAASIQVTITGRRAETPSESALRQISGANNTGMATLFFLGLLGTLLMSLPEGHAQWLALPCALLSSWSAWRLWREWKAPSSPQPSQLRTLYGPLGVRLASMGSDKDPRLVTEVCMGEVVVNYPRHWQQLIKMDPEVLHEVEIDLKHNVVRHDRLSLYDELVRFPKPRWGRYLVLVIGGVTLFLTALAVGGSMTASLSTASMRLRGQTRNISVNTAQGLTGAHPHLGDWLELKGNAQCLDGSGSGSPVAIDIVSQQKPFACAMLGWNAGSVDIGAVPMSTGAKALISLTSLASQIRPETKPAFLAGAQDDNQAAIMQVMMGILGRKLLPDVNARVIDVDTLCKMADEECGTLKQAMSLVATEADDWNKTLGLAQQGKLPDQIELAEQDAATLASVLDSALVPAKRAAQEQLFQQVLAKHPAPLMLRLQGDNFMLDTSSAENDPPLTDDDTSRTLRGPVEELVSFPFAITGELRDITNQHGRAVFEIQRSSTPQSLFSLLAAPLIGILALLLSLMGAAGLWQTLWQREKRKSAVADYTKQLVR